MSREEVFGPVRVVHRYRDLDAVVGQANDSPYGLAASVWTRSFSDAHRLSRRIEAGTVWINTHSMFDPALTIGGLKQSGYGRDSGRPALENYLERTEENTSELQTLKHQSYAGFSLTK